MREDRPPTATPRPAFWMRRALPVGLLLTALYIVTFALNSRAGGYWSAIVYEGESSKPAIHWQARFGYWEGYSDEWLGRFYSPLFRLDRHFFHPTHYLQDPDFFSWAQALKFSEWHPGSRDAFFALTKNEIEEGVAKSSLIVIAKPRGGGSSGQSMTLVAQVNSVLTGNLTKGDPREIQVFFWSGKPWPSGIKTVPALILFLQPAGYEGTADCYYEVTAEDQPLTIATLGNINSLRAEIDLMKGTGFSWTRKPTTRQNSPGPP